MGVDFETADLTVMVDEWSSFASVAVKVSGQPTAIEWSISWSGNGEFSWAQGNSVTIVDVGEFNTVSDAAAVERFADWRWFGAGPTDYQGGMWAARSSVDASFDVIDGDAATGDLADPAEPAVEPSEEPVTTETTEPIPTETEAPVVDPTETPIPLPTEEEIPVQTVTIDESNAVVLLVWDANGNAWLVPGVALTGTDSWWQTVITLIEGVIQLPEPMPIEPMPVDPMPLD
jgi:hypothetical protein